MKNKTAGFYRAFEDRFRGDRELIKSRLEVYFPFITPLKDIYPDAKALDLGCGRGEWLELLREQGFDAQGVDMDQGMLRACAELSLPVVQGDAIAYLKAQDDESCSIVSGFHIAEHIAFEALHELVAHALRVLKPGGLLILETPNPENIVVGTSNFYLDPTHQRPLPPDLLAFLPEYHGFRRSKILRLQAPAGIETRENPSLLDVLGGVSPDYAVVAQKEAAAKMLKLFSPAFEHEYGVNLNQLAQRYGSSIQATEHELKHAQSQTNEKLTVLSQQIGALHEQLLDATAQAAAEKVRVEHLTEQLLEKDVALSAKDEAIAAGQAELEQLHAHSQWLQNEWNAAKAKIDELNQSSHHWWTVAEARQQQIETLLSSKSWRITWPLRKLMQFFKWLFRLPVKGALWLLRFPKRSARWLLAKAMAFVIKRPGLKSRAMTWLRRYPRLEARLRRFASNPGLLAGASGSSFSLTGFGIARGRADTDIRLSHLTPSARRIYEQLRSAIDKSQREND